FGNFNLTAITFEPIGSETFTLGQIKVNDVFDYGGDYISIWSGGTKLYEATYLGASDAKDFGVDEGWYLRDDFEEGEFEHCKNSEVLAKGKGIVFHRGTSGAALKYSGQVQSSNEVFTGFGNFNITANTTAKTITLGDIKVNSAFDYGGDYISIWNGGTKLYEATYLGASDAADFGVDEGWYLRDDFEEGEFEHCKNSESLPPGKGFVFHRGTAGAAIILPAPLAE
ncbi:MAG: hypothetical protein IKO55_16310, partial [Kiritimatiellae bacterium]|nr:hypothetical protein [Kiritimatiellia bacterium]